MITDDMSTATPTDDLTVNAVLMLERIRPFAAELFQARKIGVELRIPDVVAKAYVDKHGEEGQKAIDLLRGEFTL